MGVNLIGWPFLKAGIGQHLRLVARALKSAGVPFVVNDVLEECFSDLSLFQNDDEEMLAYKTETPVHPVSIHCLNLNHLDRYADRYWTAGVNICFGYYELSELLDEWVFFTDRLDEVWAPTRFIQASFSRKLSIPVVHQPVPIPTPDRALDCRRKFGLHRADFYFMSSLDLRSLVERKNPLAVVRAFKQAMNGISSNCSLLMKLSMTAGDDKQEKLLASIKKAAGGDKSVKIVTDMLPRDEFEGLLAHCGCYVSLHRAEGLGLGMAEAMALGKPVIATDYSGNRDFMNASNSMPVGYRLVADPTPAKVHPGYDEEQKFVYAEPDLEHAAECMRRIYLDHKFRSELGVRARRSMKESYSFTGIGEYYKSRLAILERSSPHAYEPAAQADERNCAA